MRNKQDVKNKISKLLDDQRNLGMFEGDKREKINVMIDTLKWVLDE